MWSTLKKSGRVKNLTAGKCSNISKRSFATKDDVDVLIGEEVVDVVIVEAAVEYDKGGSVDACVVLVVVEAVVTDETELVLLDDAAVVGDETSATKTNKM